MFAAACSFACSEETLDLKPTLGPTDASIIADAGERLTRTDAGVQQGCSDELGAPGEVDRRFNLTIPPRGDGQSSIYGMMPTTRGFLLLGADWSGGDTHFWLADLSETGKLLTQPDSVEALRIIVAARKMSDGLLAVGTDVWLNGVRLVEIDDDGDRRVSDPIPSHSGCESAATFYPRHAVWDGEVGIIVVGETAPCGEARTITLVRIENGQIDADFGDGGRAVIPSRDTAVPSSAALVGRPELGRDGAIFVPFTFARQDGSDAAIAKLLPNGELDTGFGVQGVAHVPRSSPANEETWGVLPEADGVIGVGSSNVGGYLDALVFRLTPDGAIDPTFGEDGSIRFGGVYPDGAEGSLDWAVSVRADLRGGALVLGQYDRDSWRHLMVARVDDSGLDPNFGEGGIALVGPGASPLGYTYGGARAGVFDSCGGFIFAGALDFTATVHRLLPW